MAEPLRVLFLTKYPEEGASSRYRVYQVLEELERFGIEAEARSFYDSEHYRDLLRPGRRLARLARAPGAYARRLADLARARRYDLVYFQREALPAGPVVEGLPRLLGARTIFDLDDALFLYRRNQHLGILSLLKRPRRIEKIVRSVDCVCAGNRYLADWARRHNPNAIVIPAPEDFRRYEVAPKGADPSRFTIGWTGSPSTEKYLHLVADDLRELAARIPELRVKIVGGGNFNPPGVPVEHVPWTLDGELAHVRSFDVGIMPLPDDEWSRGKCGGKGRIYMAAGVAPVLTAIGYNCELVDDGVTGRLVQPGASWVKPIQQLRDDPGRRAEMAAAARRYTRQNNSFEVVLPQFADLLHEVGRGDPSRFAEAA